MLTQEIWDNYREKNSLAKSYEAWSFCGGGKAADELADLVLKGFKTATASAHRIYEMEKDPIPSVGDLSIVLKADGEAVCILRTTGVVMRRFHDVTPEHAYLEGEGDRSLEHWRKVHKEYFTQELGKHGLFFDENMLVVCETFVVEFR